LAHVPINALSGIIPHYALQICCNFVAKSESKYRKPLKILALFVQRLHRRDFSLNIPQVAIIFKSFKNQLFFLSP